MTLIEILAEVAASTTDKKITITSSTSTSVRVDEFIELVKNDSLRNCHRNDYLDMVEYLDGFDQKVAMMKLKEIDMCLWTFIKNRIK